MDSACTLLFVGGSIMVTLLAGCEQERSEASKTPTITFEVSGGSFSKPFYTFTPTLTSLTPGFTYSFKDIGVSAGHPFRIGRGSAHGGELPSWATTSGNFSGDGGSVTLNVPEDFTGELVYYCELHTSMLAPLNIQAPTPMPSTSCAADECWCVSDGGDTCDGGNCDPDECYDRAKCPGGGYWCADGAPPCDETSEAACREAARVGGYELGTPTAAFKSSASDYASGCYYNSDFKAAFYGDKGTEAERAKTITGYDSIQRLVGICKAAAPTSPTSAPTKT